MQTNKNMIFNTLLCLYIDTLSLKNNFMSIGMKATDPFHLFLTIYFKLQLK
jgi:hypothetical protein